MADQPKEQRAWPLAGMSATIALLLLILLLSVSSCQSAQVNAQQQPPHLLGVVEMNPRGGALTAQGVVAPNGWFYVINQSGSVAVLDGIRFVKLITFTVPATQPLNLAGEKPRPNPSAIAVQPLTGHIYVADHDLNAIHIISGTTVLTDIRNVGVAPILLAVQPKTGYVYVASAADARDARGFLHVGYLSVINGTEVITHLVIGGLPWSLFSNPVDARVYAGHSPVEFGTNKPSSGMLSIISGKQSITRVALYSDMQGMIPEINANKNTSEIYLIHNNTLIYWDGKAVVKRLNFGERGYTIDRGLAVDTQRGLAYVCIAQGHVFVVKQDQIIADLPVQHYPLVAVKDNTHDFVYVANYKQHSMSVIRGTEVITTLDTEGTGPWYITVDEKRGYIYVSNGDMGGSVSVFGFNEPVADKPSLWQNFLPWLGR